MAKDAYFFLFPLLLAGAGLLWAGLWPGAMVAVVLAAFTAFFFRDPDRPVPADPRAIVSPADGRVIRLEKGDGGTELSIFLSIFDVHVNRAPMGGTLVSLRHERGRFRLAWDERASIENERLILTIRDRRELTFALVAGILARRIVAWKQEGEWLCKGDRIGLIRFGSRVDIHLPAGCEAVVGKGDRVYGGSTIIARWNQAGVSEDVAQQ